MDTIRVLLVADHALLRAGLRMLLQAGPEIEVIGEAVNADGCVQKALQLRPDVVVTDLSTAGLAGLQSVRRIATSRVASRVLVLSIHTGAEYLLRVMEAGAAGYVATHSAERKLVDAVRTVARGDVFLCPGAASSLAKAIRAARDTHSRADPLRSLSAREREVLVLTAEGFSSPEIGARLALSHKTVETYRQRFMDKLHLRHRSELVRFALERGMLAPGNA